MPDVKLSCHCGKVTGVAQNVSAQSGHRLTCCCSDCQAFSQYLDGLGRTNAEPILDQFSGTDIFQMPISNLKIGQGLEKIDCVRLTSKGMYRWYTRCCNTPIGNTMGVNMPFIGVIHNFMQHQTSRVDEIGKNRAYVQTHEMKEKIPKALKGSSSRAVVRSIFKILSWKMQGLNKPSVFFEKNGKAIVKPVILNT
jgi:hypothetical protein